MSLVLAVRAHERQCGSHQRPKFCERISDQIDLQKNIQKVPDNQTNTYVTDTTTSSSLDTANTQEAQPSYKSFLFVLVMRAGFGPPRERQHMRLKKYPRAAGRGNA